MKANKPHRPKDTNQLAKYIMELSTGEREEAYEDKLLPIVKTPEKKVKSKKG